VTIGETSGTHPLPAPQSFDRSRRAKRPDEVSQDWIGRLADGCHALGERHAAPLELGQRFQHVLAVFADSWPRAPLGMVLYGRLPDRK
jgi:hypothetical protein